MGDSATHEMVARPVDTVVFLGKALAEPHSVLRGNDALRFQMAHASGPFMRGQVANAAEAMTTVASMAHTNRARQWNDERGQAYCLSVLGYLDVEDTHFDMAKIRWEKALVLFGKLHIENEIQKHRSVLAELQRQLTRTPH